MSQPRADFALVGKQKRGKGPAGKKASRRRRATTVSMRTVAHPKRRPKPTN